MTISRGSSVAGREGSSSARTPSRSVAQRTARSRASRPPAGRARATRRLKQRLVHAERRRADAGAGVGDVAASSRAWTSPSSPNGPWSAMKTRGSGSAVAQPVERLARPPRTLRRRAGRVVVAPPPGGPRGVVGRQPPPGAVKVDQDLAGPRGRGPRSASAMAVPDTTETSCSADGPPRSTMTGGRQSRSARAVRSPRRLTASRPSRRRTRSRAPAGRRSALDTPRGRARPGGGRRRRVPLRSLTMKLACFSLDASRPRSGRPFSPAPSISAPAEAVRRVPERAAGRRACRAAGGPGASAGSRRGAP